MVTKTLRQKNVELKIQQELSHEWFFYGLLICILWYIFMNIWKWHTPMCHQKHSKYIKDERGGEREGEREVEAGREHSTDVTKPLRGAYELVINVVSQWPLRDKCSSWEKWVTANTAAFTLALKHFAPNGLRTTPYYEYKSTPAWLSTRANPHPLRYPTITPTIRYAWLWK